MNINDILFKGKLSERKSQVENATESDLLRLTEDTIKQMLRKKGEDWYGRKVLHFDRVSNEWNADAKSVELYKNKVFVNFYVQYSNTDTEDCEYLSKFLGSGDYRGAIHYEDRYGNSQTSYYRFDSHDKAKVLKAICLEYLSRCKR
jgi:hypothetical protein